MAKITQAQREAYGEKYSHIDLDGQKSPKITTDQTKEGDLSVLKDLRRSQKKVKFTRK